MGALLNESGVRDLAQKAGISLGESELASMTDNLNDTLEALEPLFRLGCETLEEAPEGCFSPCERKGVR